MNKTSKRIITWVVCVDAVWIVSFVVFIYLLASDYRFGDVSTHNLFTKWSMIILAWPWYLLDKLFGINVLWPVAGLLGWSLLSALLAFALKRNKG